MFETKDLKKGVKKFGKTVLKTSHKPSAHGVSDILEGSAKLGLQSFGLLVRGIVSAVRRLVR